MALCVSIMAVKPVMAMEDNDTDHMPEKSTPSMLDKEESSSGSSSKEKFNTKPNEKKTKERWFGCRI